MFTSWGRHYRKISVLRHGRIVLEILVMIRPGLFQASSLSANVSLFGKELQATTVNVPTKGHHCFVLTFFKVFRPPSVILLAGLIVRSANRGHSRRFCPAQEVFFQCSPITSLKNTNVAASENLFETGMTNAGERE